MLVKHITSTLIILIHQSFLMADSATDISRVLATCPSGGILDGSGKFCCVSSCGSCGGYGCDKREGGALDCCTSKITQSCSNNGLPCLATESEKTVCPNDGITDSSTSFCCPSSCGECGGYDCDLRPGGASKCCTSQITKLCSSNGLPCKVEEDVPATCPGDGILDSTGKTCCSSSCGECGGNGCDLRLGGASNCCTSQITKPCSINSLPCKLDTDTTPPSDDEIDLCSDGILSQTFTPTHCEMQFCCPKSCPSCNTDYNCDLEPECCPSEYIKGYSVWLTDNDISCRTNSPPCLIPLEDDPCLSTNPCKNGAQCSVARGYTWPPPTFEISCFSRLNCLCEDVGSFYGEFCEFTCEDGEAPCGLHQGGYESVDFSPNDKCCGENETCINWRDDFNLNATCKSKDRPLTCDPNPCLNGGSCSNLNNLNRDDPYYGCSCPVGFGGVYCENKSK
mmetsp:Transcript_5546/g.7809  ORF Transcript_5546/g.7809 Transcript_5546/m.7809 type:complete len:451 (-) Transcript_5546:32-1384(-)